MLRGVRAHLHDEGLFAFETRNPRWSTRGNRHQDHDGLCVDLEKRRPTARIAGGISGPDG